MAKGYYGNLDDVFRLQCHIDESESEWLEVINS